MIDPKKQLFLEDLQEFFSATDEWKVEQAGNEQYEITYNPDDNEKEKCSSLIYQPNFQRLIRKMQQIVWNHATGNFD